MVKKGTNKSLVAGMIFFLLWIALYVVFAVIFQKGSGQATQQFIASHFNDIVACLTFKNLASPQEVIITIALYFIILLGLLIALIFINAAVKAKHGKSAFMFLLTWIFIFPLFEMVAAFYPYEAGNEFVRYTSYVGFITNPGMGIPMKILLFTLLGCAFFSAMFGIIHAIIKIVKYSKIKAELEEEALVDEERESLESVIAQREAEEARLNELREERIRQEESLGALTEGENSTKLLELIRQVVREELDKRNDTSPRIIQNFYGLRPENQVEEPKPVEEKEAAPEVIPEPVVEETPVIEEPVAEVAEESTEKKPIIRIPFRQRMIDAEKEMKDNYNELKNELLAWGLKSRLSSSGDSFRLHCKTYCKISIAGKSLKLYLALKPEDYKDSALPIQDAGKKNIYQEIPLVFKVRSGLSMRRAKALIRDACEADNLEQGAIGNEDWASKLSMEEESDSIED